MTTKAAKLKARPERFKSAPARGIALADDSLDRDAGVIRGYSVARLGVTVDDRYEFDDQTLDVLVQHGNASARGIKSRFTHPSMSDDGMGKFLGRSKNFRRDGDAVRADLFVSKTANDTPSGDLADYVFRLAEDDPDAFGASIVIAGKGEHRREADGTLQRDAYGNPLPPLLRVEKFYACDVVDDPAVDQGFFANGANDPARFAAELLDKHFAGAGPDVVRARAIAFLDRYLHSKGHDMSQDMSKTAENQAEPKLNDEQRAAERAQFEQDRKALASEKARFAEERDIRDLCAAVGAEQHVEKFLAAKLSLAEVKDELLSQRKKDHALRGDSGTRDVPDKKDPKAEAKEEYFKDASRFAMLGISLEQYTYSRQVEAAGGCFAAVPK